MFVVHYLAIALQLIRSLPSLAMADQALARLNLILESSDEDDDVLDNLLVQAAAAVAEGGEPRFVNEE